MLKALITSTDPQWTEYLNGTAGDTNITVQRINTKVRLFFQHSIRPDFRTTLVPLVEC